MTDTPKPVADGFDRFCVYGTVFTVGDRVYAGRRHEGEDEPRFEYGTIVGGCVSETNRLACGAVVFEDGECQDVPGGDIYTLGQERLAAGGEGE